MTKEIATLNWRAPEVIFNNLMYNEAVDMWSIGIIIFEMLTGELPFPGTTEMEYLLSIFRQKGSPIGQSGAQFFKNSPFLIKHIGFLPQMQARGFGPEACSPNEQSDKLQYGFGQLID